MTDLEQDQREHEQLKLKEDVLKRMKRIEGQVRGIQRMVEEGKECEDILVQVKAATSALQSSSKVILRRFLLKCIAQSQSGDESQQEKLEKLINVMSSYIH